MEFKPVIGCLILLNQSCLGFIGIMLLEFQHMHNLLSMSFEYIAKISNVMVCACLADGRTCSHWRLASPCQRCASLCNSKSLFIMTLIGKFEIYYQVSINVCSKLLGSHNVTVKCVLHYPGCHPSFIIACI